METRHFLFIIALLVFAMTLVYGQEKRLPQLPEFTTEQRWARAQDHIDVLFAAAIGYAKSVNHSADDFTQYSIKTIAPSWGKPDSVSPMRVFRGMRRNFLAGPDSKVELLDSLENKVIGRFNRSHVSRRFKDNASFYGITLAEYEGWLRGFYRGVCEYLQLTYEDKIDSEWVIFTISKKGK